MGLTNGQMRGMLSRLGLNSKRDCFWTPEETQILINAYENKNFSEEINLAEISLKLGRHKTNVCRKARDLGLTNKSREQKRNKGKKRKYATDEELRAAISKRARESFIKNGHPRGMLGKRHTAETKARISATSIKIQASFTKEQKSEYALKSAKTREANGTLHNKRPTASWKAGWRQIGDIKKYYRSAWEANYARYLQWLKENGHIKDWKHEPKTFWFEGIMRGTRSYLPDFCVTENSGAEVYHEVKGWLDDASKTKLKRMKKYHPEVTVILIDSKSYNDIKKKMSGLLVGWEFDSRGR